MGSISVLRNPGKDIFFRFLILLFKRLIIGVRTYRNEPERAGMYRNGPELTGTARNGHTKLPKRTSVGTETDFTVYRNGAECGFSSHRNEYNGYQKR